MYQEAADAIDCKIGQIVKSLVFVAGDEPFVALPQRAIPTAFSPLRPGRWSKPAAARLLT
ncbi:MAG TPA: hypothetical protein VK101_01330 [Limnochordia bacterium]|nr:hypothetical protein [Limnochordia bacterium]